MQEQPTPTKENEASALNCSGAWTEDGYIKDQDLLTGYTYRTIPAMQNSCGPVAVFNLCRRTGKKVSFNVDVTENGMEAFEDLDVADFVRFEFLGGNVFKEYEYIDGEWVQYDETTYTLNGKKLTMGQGKNADNNEIVSLTQDRLVLKDLDEEDLELEVTMKRIK